MNIIGKALRFTNFGESHGPAIGGVLDGMPAGIILDLDAVQMELDRRRPGASPVATGRREADQLQVLSGLFEGRTTGTPIAFIIENQDARPADYDAFRQVLRTGHADATYLYKYGIRDHRGGGRSSARIHASTVAAGAMARQLIASVGMSVNAFASQIGTIVLETRYGQLNLDNVYSSPVRCPDEATGKNMESALMEAREDGDTLGGCVTCIVRGCPRGLGEPVFGKLQSMLAAAMLNINAVKGFEYGDGFAMAGMRGSQLYSEPDFGNHGGGILGGISNGADITMRVAFKPIATMMRPVNAEYTDGSCREFRAKGRHDVCAVPRAVPVVEAMACLTLADALLLGTIANKC
ncbi:MAG: chorismate synthase [Muribaculaceae bacterium]|nr:chorismate synthase [Muribaculaceae bacterium]